ncbi:sulfatase-like hydrolase/transferase [Thalassoglobus sp. JC818]|uniref:sulfatase family protein n=1 Tax=Thalassoglobus sp. JC818 TaxID=3232136 RepID=UPI00345ABEA9
MIKQFRIAVVLAFVGVICFESLLLGQDFSKSSRPNIVFILTDDQAPWAMGAAIRKGLFDSVPTAATPNMDRLAAEGAMFSNFFCTTPVCSPARVAIATGRYASEFGVDDFIPSPTHKLFDVENQQSLEPEASPTFAEVFQSNGYQTGLVGKWHLGDWTLPGNERFHPTSFGFDEFTGLLSGGTTPDDPELEIDGEVKTVPGLTTDLLTDHALNFIERACLEGKPFLLCFHTRAPHGRWLPVAPEDWSPYETLDPSIPKYPDLNVEKVKKDMREYLASTSGVDRNLGRILDELDRLQISKNTIVIFSSDHGYNMGHNGIVHKGNGIWATQTKPPGEYHHKTRVISNKYRPNLYDLSLKVPTIVRWPGRVNPGSVIDYTATSLDFFPTLLAMADIPIPANLNLRGRNLTSILQGELSPLWDQDLYAEYNMIHYAVATLRCYRTPGFKLIRDFHNDGRDEFYDLVEDPEESVNLIDDPDPRVQKTIQELHEKLMTRMEEINDPLFDSLKQTSNIPNVER